MMRINMAIDYGSFANATSLNLVARKLFFEFGKLMNSTKDFTIAATLLADNALGDVNQHYDCLNVPNMGGYRFPLDSVLNSKNLVIGIVGIDEVVLGREVYKTESDWKKNKPIIEKELKKWNKNIDQIKAIHVSNNSEKSQLEEYLNIPDEKLFVIPYGVDHEKFKPPISKQETRDKILKKYLIPQKPYFIHVSESNWARKNVIRLFEAYKKAKSLGLNYNLLVVGKNDPIIHKKAKSITGIRMLGFVSEDDLVELIQGSDGLVNPSLHEGFGLPMLESISCGTPVITSNIFSPPEIIKNGGLFVDPYDTEEISKSMLELANSESLQNELSKNGLERSHDFSWEKTAQNLIKLFQTTCLETDYNYDENLEKSAKRTITTICQLHPELKYYLDDIVQFDFSTFFEYIEEKKFSDPMIHDYLLPFEKWIEQNQNSTSLKVS
jgi:glycosyltransferase involved in cell wall biosynthesis